jgi:hypothetical protein
MALTDILFSLIALVGIIYLSLWRFKQYRVDRFRQNIFDVRDDLFLYAANAHIAFDHPAYVALRNMLNGYIRFSHRISLLHLVLHSMRAPDTSETFDETWRVVTRDLCDGVQKEMNTFYARSNAQLFYFIFLSSLVKKLVVPPTLFVLFLFSNKSEKVAEVDDVKPGELTVAAYKFTEQRSEQVKHSIDHLNADAFAFGSV